MVKRTIYTVSLVTKCDHRADRKTPLGNPYFMTTEDKRNEVCDRFYSYFEDKILNNDPIILAELVKIKNLSKGKENFSLGCHCFPKRCHLDTVTYFLNNFSDSLDVSQNN